MKVEENKVTIRFTRGEFLWLEISQSVFSWAEDDYGPLDERYPLFVAVSRAADAHDLLRASPPRKGLKSRD